MRRRLGNLLVESVHMLGDVIQAVLYSKVTRRQFMNLRRWKNLKVGISPLRCEEDISLTPENDGLRLPVFQELLPCRVELNIGSIVVEEIHLNLPSVRPLQRHVVVHVPVVRTDQFWL